MTLTGELDIATAPAVEDLIDELASTRLAVELDLCGVRYVDAAGFNVLVTACVLPRDDAPVRIVASCEAVHRLVDLALDVMDG
jgi:anti-anti-sigma factor